MIPIKEFDKSKGTMKARELDALIWMLLNDKPLDLLKCRYMDGDVQPHAGYPIGHVSPDNYSTFIAAAWEVVEWMYKTHGFEGHNEFLLVCSDEDEAWYCEFPKPKWEDASANTPSLAICLAALKSVGYVF